MITHITNNSNPNQQSMSFTKPPPGLPPLALSQTETGALATAPLSTVVNSATDALYQDFYKDAVFTQFRRRPRVSKDGQEYMGYSMQTKQYHYIEWYHWDNVKKEKGNFAATELYDHFVDPNETENVAGISDKTEIIKSLSVQLSKGWKGALPKNIN